MYIYFIQDFILIFEIKIIGLSVGWLPIWSHLLLWSCLTLIFEMRMNILKIHITILNILRVYLYHITCILINYSIIFRIFLLLYGTFFFHETSFLLNTFMFNKLLNILSLFLLQAFFSNSVLSCNTKDWKRCHNKWWNTEAE